MSKKLHGVIIITVVVIVIIIISRWTLWREFYITYTNGESHYQNTVMLLLSTQPYTRATITSNIIYERPIYVCVCLNAISIF